MSQQQPRLKTPAELIQTALVNMRLAKVQLNKAIDRHSKPHSTHAKEVVTAHSDLADVIAKVERIVNP